VFAVLIVVDLVSVDQRYVNNDSFVSSRVMNKPYKANKADLAILKDDSYFRVLDVESRLPAKSAYFHNSLNGYHAAKLKRYDELYDFYISKNNTNLLNLFNVKYVISGDEKEGVYPYPNPDANGNSWFIKDLNLVANANDEILSLEKLDSKNEAVFTGDNLKQTSFKVDSLATIHVKSYKPNHLEYISSNTNKGFAVFSEMYYENGWKASIDGKETKIHRVNYAFRGLEIPAGKHTVSFKFEPQVVKTGSKIALITSVIVLLLLIGGLFILYQKRNA
jgi:hypothetical protein